jgi:hypothetical protein
LTKPFRVAPVSLMLLAGCVVTAGERAKADPAFAPIASSASMRVAAKTDGPFPLVLELFRSRNNPPMCFLPVVTSARNAPE